MIQQQALHDSLLQEIDTHLCLTVKQYNAN